MKRFFYLYGVFALLFTVPDASSFDEEVAHPAISEQAVIKSAPVGFASLDEWLRSNLDFAEGINEQLSNGTDTRTVRDWVQEGSTREDDDFRFFNHFHNPLRAWNESGLRILDRQIGRSSVLWGQNPTGTLWQDARQKYFEGLTSSTQSARQTKFAETFELLGKVIHLVQDAAVPAHTRNDPHPPWNPDGLERFMKNLQNDNLASFNELLQRPPVVFNQSILDRTPNPPLALVPIARIIDGTDAAQTEATPSTGTDQGMAEYSNANFLSGNTIFRDFTFPRSESLGASFVENGRLYFPKIADGEPVSHFVAEGVFTERLLSLSWFDKGFVLSPVVYQDYASLLVPRAVGYSAGLINYFFRGRIALPEDGRAYFFGAVGEDCCPSQQLTVWDGITNGTPGEPTGPGQLWAVFSTTENGQEIYHVSAPVAASLSGQQGLTFVFDTPLTDRAQGGPCYYSHDWPPDDPYLGKDPCRIQLVYRGPLGDEPDAVIVLRTAVDIN